MANKKQNNNNNKKDDKKFYYIFVPVMIIIVVASFLIFSYFENKSEDTMAYTKLLNSIMDEKVEKIEMTTGSTTLKVIMKGNKKEEDRTETANVPSVQAFMEWVNEKIDNGEINEKDLKLVQKNPNAFVTTMAEIFTYIPTILLIVLIIMVFKMQGLGGDSGKVYGAGEDSKKSKVKFEDVAGLEEEKSELVEVVDFLKKPDEYIKMGAKIPRRYTSLWKTSELVKLL